MKALVTGANGFVGGRLVARLCADGHEVEVTARDFAQTLQLCERFGIEHTAIGRHRGSRLAEPLWCRCSPPR